MSNFIKYVTDVDPFRIEEDLKAASVFVHRRRRSNLDIMTRIDELRSVGTIVDYRATPLTLDMMKEVLGELYKGKQEVIPGSVGEFDGEVDTKAFYDKPKEETKYYDIGGLFIPKLKVE